MRLFLILAVFFAGMCCIVSNSCNVNGSSERDVDSDGIYDNWEFSYFSTLLDCDPDADPDNDTKTNLEEFLDKTDPKDSDSVDLDSDGMDDEWELTYFDTIVECNPDDDFDGDGYTNLEEYEDGTDPTNDQDYKQPDDTSPALHGGGGFMPIFTRGIDPVTTITFFKVSIS